MSLSVAEPLQTIMRLNGEWGSPAGVIPAHVHCFAWVDVLGIVSAEFLSRAVTNADRRDLPLALLLFRQVVLQRKQLQPRFQLRCSQHWRPSKDGRKEYHCADNAWEGWGFWQIGKSQRQFVSKWICLPVSSVVSCESSCVCVCVSWFWCMLTLHLGTRTSKDAQVNRQTWQCICLYLVTHCGTLIIAHSLLSQRRFGLTIKPRHFFPLTFFASFSLYLLEFGGYKSCFFVFLFPPRLFFSLLNFGDDSLKKPHMTSW